MVNSLFLPSTLKAKVITIVSNRKLGMYKGDQVSQINTLLLNKTFQKQQLDFRYPVVDHRNREKFRPNHRGGIC